MPTPETRPGARRGARDLGEPLRLGEPGRLPRLRPLRRPAPPRPARCSAPTSPAGSTAVGPEVTAFRPGDEVYGDNLGLKGGFAEYAVAPESVLAPQAGGAHLRRGVDASPRRARSPCREPPVPGPATRVLVNGGGGGTGTFAIQVAKQAGCARDRRRQRRQARPHARPRCRRGARLPPRRLHPAASPTTSSSTSSPTARCATTGGPWRPAAATGAWAARCPTVLGVLLAGAVVGRLSGRRIGVLAVKPGPAHFEPAGPAVRRR